MSVSAPGKFASTLALAALLVAVSPSGREPATALTVTVPTVSVPAQPHLETPSATATVPSQTVGPVSTPAVTVATPTTGAVTPPPVPPVTVEAQPPSSGSTPSASGGSGQPAGSAPRSQTANAASAGTPHSEQAPGGAGAPSSRTAAARIAPVARRTPAVRRSSRGRSTARRARVRPAPAAARVARAPASPPVPRPGAHSPHRSPLSAIAAAIPSPVPLPDWSKPIILALVALALVLAVRSRVAALRTRRLERQQATLVRDMGFMQAALVPELPARIGGLRVSAAYRPSEGPAAGGDFYDVFVPLPGRVAIILGDVAGHGHVALQQAALIRYTLRAYIQAGLEPRHALALAGRALGQPVGAHFATVAVGLYDRRGSVLTYALAGHPPPIMRGVPVPEPLTLFSSPPIGWSAPTGRRQSVVALPPRSQVCFFSDGLIEARRDGGLIGREGLIALLEPPGARPDAARLLARVRGASDATPDDMAACILEPETSTQVAALHREELEADVRELHGKSVPGLIAACGVDRETTQRTLELAESIARSCSTAVIRIDSTPTGIDVSALPPPAIPFEGASDSHQTDALAPRREPCSPAHAGSPPAHAGSSPARRSSDAELADGAPSAA